MAISNNRQVWALPMRQKRPQAQPERTLLQAQENDKARNASGPLASCLTTGRDKPPYAKRTDYQRQQNFDWCETSMDAYGNANQE